jgi:signal transduction histidine kinase
LYDGDSRIVGVIGIFRSVTEQKRAEAKTNDAVRRRDEFLAMLSHELRNPLGAVVSATALLKEPSTAPTQQAKVLQIVERQAQQMARLLDDLLDVSRITRGRLEVRKARTSLESVVNSAVEIAQPAIQAGQHQLAIELPGEPLELDVDVLRIAQVLGNLLTNAAKYTPAGGRIQLQAGRAGDEVAIRVIDNGIGLEAADLPRIFEMFTQISPSRDRPNSGLGIGLALSKALVELHGGTLAAKSAGPGQGSEFIVRLALAGISA